MPRRNAIVLSIVCGTSLWLANQAFAQTPPPIRVTARTEATAGRVHGLVRDAAGRGVPDVSVLAVGQTVISARSDLSGRFQLSLPPGDYVLRASRDGYLSTYREPLRVVSTTLLERNITLTKQGVASVMPASSADDHSHSEAAWRLRQLTRSVLRDGAVTVPGASERVTTAEQRADTSSRMASVLAGTDFRGQLNFMTTAVAAPLSAWGPTSWPRGIAFFTLGAPVRGHGAWQMRAAVAAGDGSAWNLLGEYASDPTSTHVWKLGLSYSTQGYTRTSDRLTAAVAEVRTVAGVSGQDHWRVAPGLEIDYGVRAERFDYLIDPNLFSVNGGLALRLFQRTHMRASAARRMVAPGAEEFLPPPTGAPWLPAERTFFPLWGRGTLRGEEVLHGEIALVQEFGGDAAPAVHVRRFRQRTTDQMATLFGVAGDEGRGQYFVANVGAVDLVGWGVGVEGQLSRYFRGEIEYARVSADWLPGRGLRGVRRAAPSVLRPDLEQLHDVTATLEAELAKTATHISVVYRGSSAFSRLTTDASTLAGSRFDMSIRQALPYQPTRASRLELLFSIRNLFRDARGDASFYDELLTVGPPLRLMGGVQVRF